MHPCQTNKPDETENMVDLEMFLEIKELYFSNGTPDWQSFPREGFFIPTIALKLKPKPVSKSAKKHDTRLKKTSF